MRRRGALWQVVATPEPKRAESLAGPEVIAAEIVEDLGAALEEVEEFLADLSPQAE